jgi:hypothetical protein
VFQFRTDVKRVDPTYEIGPFRRLAFGFGTFSELLSGALVCRGLRGLVAAHVGQELDLNAAILLAAFRGVVRRHFLVLANTDEVKTYFDARY